MTLYMYVVVIGTHVNRQFELSYRAWAWIKFVDYGENKEEILNRYSTVKSLRHQNLEKSREKNF